MKKGNTLDRRLAGFSLLALAAALGFAEAQPAPPLSRTLVKVTSSDNAANPAQIRSMQEQLIKQFAGDIRRSTLESIERTVTQSLDPTGVMPNDAGRGPGEATLKKPKLHVKISITLAPGGGVTVSVDITRGP